MNNSTQFTQPSIDVKSHPLKLKKNNFFFLWFGIPIFILVVITIVSYQSIVHLSHRARMVELSQQKQIEIEKFIALYATARVSWRTFLTSGDSTKSSKFHASAPRIPNETESLNSLFGNDPQQLQRLAMVFSIVIPNIVKMTEDITQKENGKLNDPIEVIAHLNVVSRSDTTLEKLRKELLDEEKIFLSIHVKKYEQSAQRTINIILFGSVISISLLALAIGLFRREAKFFKAAEVSRLKSEEHFYSIAQSAMDAVISIDSGGNIIFWNNSAQQLFGYSNDAVIGKPLINLMQQGHREAYRAEIKHLLATKHTHPIGTTQELAAITRTGTEFPIEISIAMWQSDGDIFFTAVIRDITERKTAEDMLLKAHHELEIRVQERTSQLAALNKSLLEEIAERVHTQSILQQRAEQLAISEQRFTKIFHASPAPMIIIRSKDGVIVDENDSYLRLLNYLRKDVIGHTMAQIGILEENEYQKFWDALIMQRSVRDMEVGLRTSSGEKRTALVSVETTELGGEECFLAIIIDITERKMAEVRALHVSQHDALTGLANRILMQDRINQAITHAHRANHLTAVLFIDLDHFKHINDSLGHGIGDKLLLSIAERLVSCVRNSDTVCRQGGDEFLILLSDITHASDAVLTAEKIRTMLTSPHSIDTHVLHVGVSIGVSVYPSDGQDAETLIKNADTAMYHAKENGRNNYQFFTQAMNIRSVEHQSIESGLRRAMERSEFVL